MMGKTHLAVGVAVGIAAARPGSLGALAACAAMAAVGSVFSDVDSAKSGARRKADWTLAACMVVATAAFAADSALGLGLRSALTGNPRTAEAAIGAVAFAALCAYGRTTPHRSFTHSLMALLATTACVSAFAPATAVAYAAAFASHLALDLTNRRRTRLLWPIGKGARLGLCASDGPANRAAFAVGVLGCAVAVATSPCVAELAAKATRVA